MTADATDGGGPRAADGRRTPAGAAYDRRGYAAYAP